LILIVPPVQAAQLTPPLETLIASNRQWTKDKEQVGREADALMGIEKERAKRRQIAVQNNNAAKAVKETIPEQDKKPKSQTRDTVGEKVEVSGRRLNSLPSVSGSWTRLVGSGRRSKRQGAVAPKLLAMCAEL
jgi:hypothetical protein